MWEHSFGNGVWVAVVVLWDDICVCAYVGAKWGVGVREPVQIETRMGHSVCTGDAWEGCKRRESRAMGG